MPSAAVRAATSGRHGLGPGGAGAGAGCGTPSTPPLRRGATVRQRRATAPGRSRPSQRSTTWTTPQPTAAAIGGHPEQQSGSASASSGPWSHPGAGRAAGPRAARRTPATSTPASRSATRPRPGDGGIRIDVVPRHEHEGPLVRARMREREVRVVEHLVVEGEHVDVERARPPAHLRVAVPAPARPPARRPAASGSRSDVRPRTTALR